MYEHKLTQQTQLMNNLLNENHELKSKNAYLENKIKEIINKQLAQLKTNAI